MIILSYHHLRGSILRASLAPKSSVGFQSPIGDTLACFESLRSRLELLRPHFWHQEEGPSFLRPAAFGTPPAGTSLSGGPSRSRSHLRRCCSRSARGVAALPEVGTARWGGAAGASNVSVGCVGTCGTCAFISCWKSGVSAKLLG